MLNAARFLGQFNTVHIQKFNAVDFLLLHMTQSTVNILRHGK